MIPLAEETLAFDPENTYSNTDFLRNNLAFIYAKIKRDDEAIKQYEINTRHSTHPVWRTSAHSRLAVFYQQTQPEKVFEAINQAIYWSQKTELSQARVPGLSSHPKIWYKRTVRPSPKTNHCQS